MPNNPLEIYANISANASIAFKHGPQSALNTMIQNGGAEEGTFYLTDDTQKLYVGRTKNGNTYPVQVSRGVTVVANTTELPIDLVNQQRIDDSLGAIEEGELYYITDENILAALRVNPNDTTKYEWIQINPPGGLSGVTMQLLDNDSPGYVRQLLSIQGGDGNSVNAATFFYEGNNIQLEANNTSHQITISATDSLYALGTEDNSNIGVIGLRKDDGTTFDSALNITSTPYSEGVYSVKVSSNSNTGAIEINGPMPTALNVTPRASDFLLKLQTTSGNGQPVEINTSFSPNISYGSNPASYDPSAHNNANTLASVFNAGTAALDVYTVAQTEERITARIHEQLQTADALSYKGAITNSDYFSRIYTNNANGVYTGDVYKIATSAPFTMKGQTVKSGDLIIINGGSTYPGKIPNSAISSGADALDNYIEIIPSGDETELQASITSTPGIKLLDVAGSNSDVLLNVSYTAGSAIDISANNLTNNVGSNVSPIYTAGSILISHANVAHSYNTNAALQSNDPILMNNPSWNTDEVYSFFALAENAAEAITVDDRGHVTQVKGTRVNFKHNKLQSLRATYSSNAINSYANNANVLLSTLDDINNAKSVRFNFSSDTLKFGTSAVTGSGTTAAGTDIKIDLVWGTFN